MEHKCADRSQFCTTNNGQKATLSICTRCQWKEVADWKVERLVESTMGELCVFSSWDPTTLVDIGRDISVVRIF